MPSFLARVLLCRPWDGGSAPEPNNTVCGELRQNAHLGVRTCTTAQRYICEKVLGAKISCDVGWTEYGEKCYMVSENALCYL